MYFIYITFIIIFLLLLQTMYGINTSFYKTVWLCTCIIILIIHSFFPDINIIAFIIIAFIIFFIIILLYTRWKRRMFRIGRVIKAEWWCTWHIWHKFVIC